MASKTLIRAEFHAKTEIFYFTVPAIKFGNFLLPAFQNMTFTTEKDKKSRKHFRAIYR